MPKLPEPQRTIGRHDRRPRSTILSDDSLPTGAVRQCKFRSRPNDFDLSEPDRSVELQHNLSKLGALRKITPCFIFEVSAAKRTSCQRVIGNLVYSEFTLDFVQSGIGRVFRMLLTVLG